MGMRNSAARHLLLPGDHGQPAVQHPEGTAPSFADASSWTSTQPIPRSISWWLDHQQQLSAIGLGGRCQILQQLEQLAAVAQMAVGDLADHPRLAIFAPMNSVAAAYMAIDPVELLMIAHNSRIDRCTDHQ